jgi:hypothetical protein
VTFHYLISFIVSYLISFYFISFDLIRFVWLHSISLDST